jgi:hypothetical protein
VPDEVPHARALRLVEHRSRLRGVERERLLAQHVLPGPRGFDRERRVRGRRRRDRDGDNAGQRERIGERGRGVSDP